MKEVKYEVYSNGEYIGTNVMEFEEAELQGKTDEEIDEYCSNIIFSYIRDTLSVTVVDVMD